MVLDTVLKSASHSRILFTHGYLILGILYVFLVFVFLAGSKI